jgi:hypothetical protein
MAEGGRASQDELIANLERNMTFRHALISGIALSLCASAAGAADYYSDVAEWQVNSDSSGGYSISSPFDFDVQQPPAPGGAAEWHWNSTDPGNVLFELTIPRALEPQTNFGGATLTVGSSSNAKSVADCLAPEPAAEKSWKQKIGGVEFVAFSASDNGMSHYHDITSFRALHGGKCYAIEYTIESTSIGVYPPAYALKAFDEPRVKAILDRIVGTFRFT